MKTPNLVQQCRLPRVLQTNQSWNKCFNKLVWSGHRCRRSTYKAFFDEDAPNSVDGLYACDPAKNALLAFFCAFLDSAALEVFDPTFPWNCPSVRTQSCWNLTCQTWEAGLFLCCRCCRRLSDQRPLALDQGLPVGQTFRFRKQTSKNLFHLMTEHVEELCCDPTENLDNVLCQSLPAVDFTITCVRNIKKELWTRKPCCSSSRKVPRWSIYWPHTLSLHFRLLLQTKRSNWCIKSHEDPMKKIIDISVAWNLLKKKL